MSGPGRPQAPGPRDMRIRAELDPDAVLCPFCASSYLVDDVAGRVYGACTTCYRKALAAAVDDEMREVSAMREYATARKRLQRMREEEGLGPAGKDKRRKPRF